MVPGAMAAHALERLELRTPPVVAERGFELLRDHRSLAAMLQRVVPPDVFASSERFALPLADGDAPAHLIVARDGHGVTTLGAGMGPGRTHALRFGDVMRF